MGSTAFSDSRYAKGLGDENEAIAKGNTLGRGSLITLANQLKNFLSKDKNSKESATVGAAGADAMGAAGADVVDINCLVVVSGSGCGGAGGTQGYQGAQGVQSGVSGSFVATGQARSLVPSFAPVASSSQPIVAAPIMPRKFDLSI